MANEQSLDDVELVTNPERRCPCVLLLDTSSSMQGDRIDSLNQGLWAFRDEVARDNLAARRVEVAIVTFDSEVTVPQDFVTVDRFVPPTLTAQGLTHMGSGINKALDLLDARKSRYRSRGVEYYRPWVFMITDGAPQGEPDDVVILAAERLRAEERKKGLSFFAVAVEGARMSQLEEISEARAPLKLRGLQFVELFAWLSRSIEAQARSNAGDMVALPSPDGWASLEG